MILTTKLNIPRPEADTLVDRPRLVTALNRPLPETGPVLLVQAPAGFGKTTALAQWAAARKTPPAWVSLDEGDNAPQRFWIYVLNALENRFPKHFAPLITLVETGQHPGWAETITALLNTIHALATPVTLVLDDLHRVESPMVLDGLNFMVDHPLAGFTLVLASRTRPPLGLSRLRGRGRLGEINARDLAFNPKEIQSLTRGFAPPPMDTPTLDLLFEKTEGWIAGVKLALISLGENPKLDLKKFSGNAAHVRDFLMEEVYTHLPPHLKKTMARLAVLDRFSPDLCRALGGRPTCLEEMKSRHLFLIPLDNEGIWYRFHHLFQDFLARLLPEMEDPARAHDLAAQYFETHDLFEEGFAHALAARTPDRAAHILAKKAVDLYDWGGDDALWPHLSQLPQTAIDQEPILVCYQACILTYQGK
ncbi:MAG: hypothetical protein MI749_12720, partial [Desulfovibrionales bacterium]|nr:hypothetical protein [Desulfovibrionales bacterium]